MSTGAIITLWIVVALVVILLALSLRRVPPMESHIVNRLGRAHRTLQPGWHWLLPFVDRVAHRVSMSGRVLEVTIPELETEDRQPMKAEGVVYFQVLDVDKALEQIGMLEDAARNLTVSTTRELVHEMSGSALQQRTTREINAWLLGLLNQSSEQWGVRITRVELDFKPEERASG